MIIFAAEITSFYYFNLYINLYNLLNYLKQTVMKKRLLFAFMAMCVAVSGFALEKNEYVYTPQGRFQIIGDNLNANNAFQNMDGWTAIGEGKTLADLFNVNANGLADGMNSVQSLSSTAGEGMYFKFEPSSASDTYVVSFKMRGAVLDNVRIRIPGDGYKTESNLVKVAGNSDNAYTHPSTDGEVIVNTAEELTSDWQTFNYAIVGDNTPRTWFISFTAMANTIEIADLQIAPAVQLADLRLRDAMLDKLSVYKNCYKWSSDVLEEYAFDEAIEGLQKITDESNQTALDEALATAKEILDEFIVKNMDDYLAGSYDNYLSVKTTSGNTQKVDNIGVWNCLPSGRGHWMNSDYPDMAHFAGNTAWNYGNVNDPIGVYTQKTFDPGSYVFAIESRGAVREDPTSSSWTTNDGLKPAYAIAYVVKIVDGAAADTIASEVRSIEALNYTQFMVTAKIEEAGTYEVGLKAYCKDAYKDLKNGSVVYVKDASIWGKNNNKYNQKQLGYETDVREQISTGRTQLTTATTNIADANYFWGKATLQACVDTVEVKIAAYEAMTQDDIIATYEDDYVKSTTDSTGYMVREVYQTAVKDIIAANKLFVAVNDTLASIQTAIENVEIVKGQRLYDAATGKDAFQTAINDAKNVQSQMKAAQYSQENAAAIVAAIKALDEAVEVFKASVPASAIATIIDIDFEQDAVLNAETQLYSVPGTAGSMEFSTWSTDGSGSQPFEKGYWSNGEQLWKGYIRVGNGTGTTLFDATENGSMGTNILKVACDFYIQGLSGRDLGFFLKNAAEGQEETEVFGLLRNYYNGTTTTNTCDLDVSVIWAKSGGSYNNASPSDADTLTANPLQKTHFEVILDYGRKSMYCTANSVNGSATSKEIVLESIPNKFVLQSNYNNNDRRPWFDNLKIQRITAGSTEPFVPSGIVEMTAPEAKVAVPSKYIKNGRIVINGKYGINGVLIK